MTESQRHHKILDQQVTGVAVPVSSLRSTRSCGIGEFLDLPLLGEWCVDAGLSLIQILPVNDTGSLSSPYSAVSAFALHPVYIRLDDVPGSEQFRAEIDEFRSIAEGKDRSDHENVLGFKMGILYRTYRSTLDDEVDRRLDLWVSANDWVRPYSVYKCLKDRNDQRSWVDWPEYGTPTDADVNALWIELGDFARFYAWIQMHLDEQFRLVSELLRRSGIYLKGDIPILMNVDSVDVWLHRRFFDLRFGAGAPPDMFTRTGQTWGFPIYKWDEIEADGYSWWEDRLQVAANYYDVYRIDHVIGFFRIWSQPEAENTAILGHYEPSVPVTAKMMEEAGLSPDEIRLLVEAWTTRTDAVEALGDDADRVLATYFHLGSTSEDQADTEFHFLNPSLAGERLIDRLGQTGGTREARESSEPDEPDDVRDFLLTCHRDRSFVPNGPDSYYPAWYWDESKGFSNLNPEHTIRFNRLVDDYRERAQPIWMELGRKSLVAVSDSTDMLACAEDLGAVPDGLRDVLEELGILSLKIERWEEQEDGTLTDPSEFPHLSVSTPSVHDLSTLRVWWEESDEHLSFYDELGMDGECPPYLTIEVAEAAMARSLRSSSAIVVFQIQDLFSLSYDLRMDPVEVERINVPGTVGDHNWSYRIPVTIENLREHDLSGTVRGLVSTHRLAGEQTTAR